MPIFRIFFVILTSLFIFSPAQADEHGANLYNTCSTCHGAKGEGNQQLNGPAISNLSEKYISDQIKKFKAGHRGSDPKDAAGMQMKPMAMVLQSDEDIAAVSAYAASLESKPKQATLTGGDATKGQALYATCASCHGAKGEGNDQLNAPALREQHDWYLSLQLKNYKEGVRGGNPEDVTGAQMRQMAMMLADEQAINDVVAYIMTLSAE